MAWSVDWLECFWCPRCHGALSVAGNPPAGWLGDQAAEAGSRCGKADGALQCSRCGCRYPVARGVARFVGGDAYTGSFSHQWNRFEVQRPAEDEEVFRTKTGVEPGSLAGQWVLDAGCGSGRYAAVAARHGARVVAVDLSRAVEKAADVCRPLGELVAVLQADLLHLPLLPERFDLVFSLGVLHHSPDPRGAFRELARRVKPGGRLAVWLYRRNTAVQEAINTLLRGVTTRLAPRQLERLCLVGAALGGIPLVNRTLNKLVNFSNHPSWAARLCDTFDWYSPRYQSHHTPAEVRGWFEQEGLTQIQELPPAKSGRLYRWAHEHDLIVGSGVNVVGVKPAN